jgi:hypothetical protein
MSHSCSLLRIGLQSRACGTVLAQRHGYRIQALHRQQERNDSDDAVSKQNHIFHTESCAPVYAARWREPIVQRLEHIEARATVPNLLPGQRSAGGT